MSLNINNVDPEEVAKFNAMATYWWDVQGDLKTLHQLNPLRLSYITKKVSLIDKTVVDIGCGGGILSESMAKMGARVTGIDLSKSVIQVANLHQHESGTNVEYINIAAEELAQQRAQLFDVVTCMEVLEHVPDPLSTIRACAQLAKPGGHVFFSTLNRNVKSYLFAILGAEYLLRLLPKNTHDYAKFIRPSELNNWIKQSDLLPREMKGISYHPFTEKFNLTDDISVNYLFYAIKPL